MLSDDLRNLRGVFSRRVAMFDGQVFLDARQADAVVNLLDDLTDRAERLEQAVVPSCARALPDGVIDLNAERRRRAATPAGGSAA
ncbi:hypothetical protein ACJ41P_26525 [Azospirillum argentinense]|uniref:Uncharacterized protein n=1 Tax=Azospirillum argentinense TaxID=2970906 RepID=A0ABW8VEB9_9PROT